MLEFVKKTAKNYGRLGNWIQGEESLVSTEEYLPVTSPYNQEVLGQVPLSQTSDLQFAIESARDAFPEWSAMHIKKRVQVMFRLKAILEEHVDEFSELIAIENGKLPSEAKAALLKGIEVIEFGCSIPNMISGNIQEVSSGVACSFTREPLGVVACITPFNFPAMIPLWTIPIALTVGNTMVLKPSEQVPLSALRLAAYLKEAGLPDGVFNVLNGDYRTVEGLCEHPDVKAISFVGSSKVAEAVYVRGCSKGKRVLALGGAKNHLVLMPDANPEITASGIVDSAMGSAGQRCMAASMLLAVGDVSKHLEAMVDYTNALKPGKDLGAIVNQESVERIVKAIDEAESMGAKVLVDGRRSSVLGYESGNWVGPTLIDETTADMGVTQEEVFGPVLPIRHVASLEEALSIENANPYGNAASIFTSSGAAAHYFSEHASAGMIGVNIGVPVPREPFAFGGWNHSKFGMGDITGEAGIRFWTKDKKVTTKWEALSETNWMS